MDISEFLRRYDAAIKGARTTNRAACLAAGVKEDTTRNPRRKGTSPDLLAVIKLANALNVAPLYFLEPLGITAKMLRLGSPLGGSSEVVEDPTERALLRAWRVMDEADRATVGALFERLTRAVNNSDAA